MHFTAFKQARAIDRDQSAFLATRCSGIARIACMPASNHDSHEDHVCMCISARRNKYSAPFIVVMAVATHASGTST